MVRLPAAEKMKVVWSTMQAGFFYASSETCGEECGCTIQTLGRHRHRSLQNTLAAVEGVPDLSKVHKICHQRPIGL